MPLYIVSTPIGNLEDITYRAVRVLQEAHVVAAEDTRVTGRLLKHLGIESKMVSYHEHNERKRAPALMRLLHEGKNIALVSNAGTPPVSDPGYILIRACIDENIPVIPVPGPAALIAAVSGAGLPVHEFWFRGFPPRKPGKRKRFLEVSARSPATLIFYESPHRIRDLVRTCRELYGERRAALCRELTKKHEEFIRATLPELVDYLAEAEPRGEYVLVIEGLRDVQEVDDADS